MKSTSVILLFLLTITAHAQTRFTILKAKSQPDPNSPNTWLSDVTVKVTAGELKLDQKDFEFALPNGDKAYVRAEIFDNYKTGQTGQAILTCYNGDPKVGQVLGPRGSFPVKAPANRVFEGTINQAFLGEGKDEYLIVPKTFSGHLLPNDVIQTVGPKGERCQATVLSIDYKGQKLDMLSPAMTDAMVMVKSAGCVLNSDYKMSLSGAKTMTAEAAPAKATNTAFKGKRTVFPVNAVLKTGGLSITINNVVQYFPVDGMMVKVDTRLNYYVLDATYENTSGQVIDAGDYTLRLNFYDAQGNSADEFGRIFKNEKNKTDDASRGADILDKEVFAGSSSLRFATIAVAYQTDLPVYDQKAYDAVWKPMQPGQKVRCEVVKVIGVPKDYKPTSVGTWKSSKRELVTVPVVLK